MLNRKVAIVTGGASGIGLGIVSGLADKGITIVIADMNLSGAEKVAAELISKTHQAAAVRTDVTSPADVESMVARTVELFGRVDILVNNAGIDNVLVPALDMNESQWDTILGANLKGQFLCSQAVAKVMIKQGGGKIINVASAAGHGAIPDKTAYCVSKAGVLALTRNLAVEWAKYNINVNSISPGRTNTPLVQALKMKQSAEVFERRTKRIPLGRIAQMEDIAKLVLFLASQDSDYITGQDIIIDGGLLAMHPGHVLS